MSALAVSQIQKHFITNQIYKRSKRYFDVIKLKSIQHHDSKYRRKPQDNQRQELQKKIQNSFMSSQQYFNKKRQNQIEKCKKRRGSYQFDDADQIQTNYSVITKNNSNKNKKVIDMNKSLPRQFYQNLQTHTYTCIQDPFDNFVMSDFNKGQKGKSIDFNKILGRKNITDKEFSLGIRSKYSQQQQNPQQEKYRSAILSKQSSKLPTMIDTSKAYDKFYFDQSKFKCLIDVDKQRKAQHRKLLRTGLRQDYEMKQISLQKIDKGRQLTQKQTVRPTSLMFYHGKGIEQPSVMHTRILRKNENYWMQQLKIMKKQDFETVKRRQVMIQKRLRQIKSRRQVIDTRGQICDAKYFLRNKHQ